jgi:hypothetical protein
MTLGATDRDSFFSDFAEDVSAGAVTAKGIIDDSEEAIFDSATGEFLGPAVRIMFWTSDWPAGVIDEGETITRVSDAAQYRITRRRRIQDGRLTEVFCAKL